MRANPLYSLSVVPQLDSLTGKENSLTSQLSSGLRVQQASDDPLAASTSVRLGSAIARDAAYVNASTGIQSRLQVADSALGSVVTQITSAIALAVKGTNGTMNSADLQAIAQQLGGIRDEVVSLANSSYAGTYLFSGTQNVQPFSNDTTTTPATVTYSGDTQQQSALTPGGQALVTSVPGSAIFSASGANVLASLNSLIAGFASGDTSTSLADLNELKSALTNVSAQRSILDASLNTLQLTTTYAQTEQASLTASQTSLVSTDSAAVATDLSNNESQQKALLSVMAAIGKTNLFDYMQ